MKSPEQMSDAELLAEMSALRAQKESLVSRLRSLVHEHDDRAAMAELVRKAGPRLAQRLMPQGIPSTEKVGEVQ